MTVLGNLLWLVIAGLWLAVSYLFAGVASCLTIVGIPFGVQAFKLGGYALWPFGRVVVERPNRDEALGCLGNAVWLVLGGWWLALLHLLIGLVFVVTIVGIPLGVVSFRMAGLALWPFGKMVVRDDNVPPGARVVIGPVRKPSTPRGSSVVSAFPPFLEDPPSGSPRELTASRESDVSSQAQARGTHANDRDALVMMSGPPGWYPDPSGMPGQRWWDGDAWTERWISTTAPPPGDEGPSRWRSLKWWQQWAIVFAGLALLVGGGTYLAGAASTNSSTPARSASPPPVGTGYLATGPGYVDFIQWNDNNGSLSGTAQTVTTQGTAPNLASSSQTLSVSGTLNGSNISLSFDGGPQTFGTIGGESLTLNFPQPDGTLAPITFDSASTEQYNSAVASLNQQVAQANQTAANAQALQQEEQKIGADAAQVNNDIAGASDTSALTSAVSSVQSALAQEATDLAATKAEEQKVQSEAANGDQSQTCYDAEQGVAYDASQGVAYDDSQGVEYSAQQGVEYQAKLFRGRVSSLQSDFAQLESDEANLPGYQLPSTPSQGAVMQAVSTLNAAVSTAISTTNDYIDQANAEVTTAYQYVAQAYQAGNCGSPPSAPAPQPHIS